MDAAILIEELGWHRTGWAISLAKHSRIDKIFLSDPSGKNIHLIQQATGKKLSGVYSSPEELLANHDVELAFVTMAPSRMPCTIEIALRRGIHVLCEKPAALNPAQYQPLVELANKNSLNLTMALMASRIAEEARELISKNILGQIYGINYISMDHQRWRRKDDFKWVFSKKEAGGGILAHLACHGVHTMRRIIGSEIVEVTGFADVVTGANIDVEDTAMLCARFKNGAVGMLHSGYWGPSPYQPVETEITGIDPTGKLEMDPSVPPVTLPEGHPSVQPNNFRIWGELGSIYGDNKTGTLVLDTVSQSGSDTTRIGPPMVEHKIKRVFQVFDGDPTYEGAKTLEGENTFLCAFIGAIKGECSPPNSNEDGLRFLEIQHALYSASETGKTQKLSIGR